MTHQDDPLWYDYETEERRKRRFPFWKCVLIIAFTVAAIYLLV